METEIKNTRTRLQRHQSGPHKHSARQIQLLRKNADMTQAELAAKIGVHQATVSKWENADELPGGDTLTTLASFLGVHPNEITGTGIGVDRDTPIGRKVKVIGEIAAGEWAETHEIDDPFYVAIPAVHKKWAKVPLQAFKVKGDSMNLLFPDGSIVYVAPINSVKDALRSGQVVRVMAHRHGETEATLKEYVVDANGGKWLLPRSSHPAHQAPVDYAAKGKAGESIEITGVVIGSTIMLD